MNENTEEQLSSFLSDSSFVILGQGSLPPELNTTQNGYISKIDSINTAKNSVSVNGNEASTNDVNKNLSTSWGCESGSQDIQVKLDQLLKENYQLKETLNQNNLAMKTQFETLVMWQQEVFKTHQSHKQKFSETRDLVLKLRAENTSLKKQLEEGILKSQSGAKSNSDNIDLEQENFLLRQQVNELQEKSLLQSKYDGAPTKREEELNSLVENLRLKLQTAEQISKQRENFEEELLKVKKDLDMYLKLNENLKKENEELELKLKECQRGRTDSLPSLLPNSEARAQISNLFKQLEEERMKVSMLKEELKTASSNASINTKETASSQLSDCISRLDDMSLSYNKQNERFSSMSSWLCLAEESMIHSHLNRPEETENRLKSEISFLKKHLMQEQASSMEKKESLQKMQVQFEKLLRDYEELQEQWKKFEKEEPKLKKYEEDIEKLKLEVKEKDELVIKKEKELEKVKEEQKKLELQCEEVGILRAQVEVYQTDFNAEREAREKLAGEKAEMAERIRLLQRRVQELESGGARGASSNAEQNTQDNIPKEVPGDITKGMLNLAKAIKSSGSNAKKKATKPVQKAEEVKSNVTSQPIKENQKEEEKNPPEEQSASAPDAALPANDDEDTPLKPYSCFKCEKSFRELRQLQEHVEECLELTN